MRCQHCPAVIPSKAMNLSSFVCGALHQSSRTVLFAFDLASALGQPGAKRKSKHVRSFSGLLDRPDERFLASLGMTIVSCWQLVAACSADLETDARKNRSSEKQSNPGP